MHKFYYLLNDESGFAPYDGMEPKNITSASPSFQVCHKHELLPLLLLRLTFWLFEDVGEPALAAVLRKKLLNYTYRPLSGDTFIFYIYSKLGLGSS